MVLFCVFKLLGFLFVCFQLIIRVLEDHAFPETEIFFETSGQTVVTIHCNQGPNEYRLCKDEFISKVAPVLEQNIIRLTTLILIGIESVDAFLAATALIHNTTVQHLVLRPSRRDKLWLDRAVEKLAYLFNYGRSSIEIFECDCLFSIECVTRLVLALSRSTVIANLQLTFFLDLDRESIIDPLQTLLTCNKNLTHVDLLFERRDNNGITSLSVDAAEKLITSLRNSNIVEFRCFFELKVTNFGYFGRTERERLTHAVEQSLPCCPRLELIDLAKFIGAYTVSYNTRLLACRGWNGKAIKVYLSTYLDNANE